MTTVVNRQDRTDPYPYRFSDNPRLRKLRVAWLPKTAEELYADHLSRAITDDPMTFQAFCSLLPASITR